MPVHEQASLLTSELSALARDQLQMQTSRSGTLNAGALAVMAIDAGLATFVIDTKGAHGLWIAALTLLGVSFALAIRALRLRGGEETGPSVARLRAYREMHDQHCREMHDQHWLSESLLEDLATDVQLNDRALARKALLFERALTPLVLAILIDLAGRL